MKLNLSRPLVFFDVEATGLDITKDRIIEISILKVSPDSSEEQKTYRINPECTIPEASIRIHGIKNADVDDCPVFKDVAHEIVNLIKGCDLAGYNSNKFDIPILAEEFIRADIEIDLKKSKFVDVQTIFFKMEQRTLKAAYEFYCEKVLENAHAAEEDTKATYQILMAQLDRYPNLKNDVGFLSKFTTQTKFFDFAGRVVLNDKKIPVFNFGKYKGQSVEDVFNKDTGYYNWIMNGDFPLYTKKILTSIKLTSAFKSKGMIK